MWPYATKHWTQLGIPEVATQVTNKSISDRTWYKTKKHVTHDAVRVDDDGPDDALVADQPLQSLFHLRRHPDDRRRRRRLTRFFFFSGTDLVPKDHRSIETTSLSCGFFPRDLISFFHLVDPFPILFLFLFRNLFFASFREKAGLCDGRLETKL